MLYANSLAAYFFSTLQQSLDRAIGHLGPIIQDRLHKENEHGGPNWLGKPVSGVSSCRIFHGLMSN